VSKVRRVDRSSRGVGGAHNGDRSVPGERRSYRSKTAARVLICACARSTSRGVRATLAALAVWVRLQRIRRSLRSSVRGLASASFALAAAARARGVAVSREAHEVEATRVLGGDAGDAGGSSTKPRGEKTEALIESPCARITRTASTRSAKPQRIHRTAAARARWNAYRTSRLAARGVRTGSLLLLCVLGLTAGRGERGGGERGGGERGGGERGEAWCSPLVALVRLVPPSQQLPASERLECTRSGKGHAANCVPPTHTCSR
jgi:hypothetical protein